MMFIYSIVYSVVFILYLPILFFKGKLHRGFIQRLGWIDPPLRYRLLHKTNIWFHAVSVGEVLAIIPLIERIRTLYLDRQFVITTVTKTGYAIAHNRLKKEDVLLYAPLDFGFSVNSYVSAIKPEICITAETELWPRWLTVMGVRDIPVVLVNGRISEKSYYRYRRFLFLFSRILRVFRHLCMQSTLDADRAIALGANPKNVIAAGSMKFDDLPQEPHLDLSDLGISDSEKIWIAGSTHPGEEKIMLNVYSRLRKKYPALTLIVAPRHVERTEEICSLIKGMNLEPASLSKCLRERCAKGKVIVVDTMGHLKSLYRIATVVFVGKSLVGMGGQNIIEPAIFGKPIIVGSHMENFADITDIFLSQKAIIQIQAAFQLEEEMLKLLASPDRCQTLGERARRTVLKNQGATKRTEKAILNILSTTHFHKPT